MKNQIANIFVIILTVITLSSCPTPYKGNAEEDGLPYEDGEFKINEGLFEQKTVGGSPFTKFSLNDQKYIKPTGYTVWKVDASSEEVIFSSKVVTLSKISGNSLAGYGIIICQAVRADYGITMLTVMINTEGNFAIGKVINGNYEEIKGWTYSGALKKGYGNENKLDISYNDDTKEFTLKINDIESSKYVFTDITLPKHSGGKNGYIVVISPNDKFPEKSAEVDFIEN